MVRAIVGANWGDEGKGKITDMLASESDIVVRFQGGANAGHTIINDYGRFALHLLPSGVCTPGVVNVLGPGVALDIEFFLKELAAIEQQGLPAPKILISERAQVLMPYHVALDCYEEERLGKNSFGSTKSGIAPFYGDKFQKIGLQLCQLYYPDVLREKLAHALDIKNAMIVNLYHREPVDLEALIVKLTELAEEIGEAPYFLVGDGADLCYNTIKENCTGLRLAPAELRFATGFGVAAAALPLFREGKACSPQELDAFYLRRPQAERERMARLAQTKQQTTPHN